MSNLNVVFPAQIQNEVRNSFEINENEVVKLVRKAINNERVRYTWNGLTHNSIVTSHAFRHMASNYELIINSDWFINLKNQYGEAIHLLLKVDIMNRISTAIVKCSKKEYESLDYKSTKEKDQMTMQIQELQDKLQATIDSYNYEIEGLKSNISALEAKNVELDHHVLDLDIQVYNLQKENSAQAQGIELLANRLEAVMEQSSLHMQQSSVHIQQLNTTIEHQDTIIQQHEVTIHQLEVNVEELKTELKDVKASLTRLENCNLTFAITANTAEEAREIAFNCCRTIRARVTELDSYGNAEVDEQVKEVLVTDALTTRQYIEDVIIFIQPAKAFISVDAELAYLNSLLLDCFYVIERLKKIQLKSIMEGKHVKHKVNLKETTKGFNYN